jgi:hypothetical protein
MPTKSTGIVCTRRDNAANETNSAAAAAATAQISVRARPLHLSAFDLFSPRV